MAGQAGDLEGPQDSLGRADQNELAVTRREVPQRVQQHAEAGGVHEGHLGEVHNDCSLALVCQSEEAATQLRRRMSVDLPPERHDVGCVVDGFVDQPEVDHGVQAITTRSARAALTTAAHQPRCVGTGELGRLTRAGAGTRGSLPRRRAGPGAREWSRTRPRPRLHGPSGSLMPPPPGPSRPPRGPGPSPPPPSSPRESSSSSRSLKNQISQMTSRPTSKTRKPTMKIHPSVVIVVDASAMTDPVEGLS